MSPAAIARAIVFLRAQGKHDEADFLATHLPPSSGPLQMGQRGGTRRSRSA
jgi:hypothetical protein